MTVWHVPEDAVNPYQHLLRDALARQGIAVSFQDDPAQVCEQAARANGDPQILHLHWLPRGTFGPRNLFRLLRYGLAVRRFRRRGGTVVWTAHNLYSHELKNRGRERRLRRFLLGQCHGVIVHSPRAEQIVRHEFQVAPQQRFAVIPHANVTDYYPHSMNRAEALQRLGLSSDQRIVAFVGNIRPYKGVPELIQAFRAAASPAARLVIAGRTFDAQVARTVAELVSADRLIVFRPGLIEESEFQVYLKAADVVALPYLNILTSGAAVLAMSFGKACIAPLSGCLPDILSQQPELLYDPASSGSLAATLARALGHPEVTQACGARNLQRAAQWTWDEAGRQTAEFYRRCRAAAGTAARPMTPPEVSP